MSQGLPRELERMIGEASRPGEVDDVTGSILESVDATDTYGGGHSQRVAALVESLARVMGLTDAQVDLAARGGRVHDIGKLALPIAILRKAGELTPDEIHLVRLHPIFGASIVSRLTRETDLVPLVLHHHERWDGHGYPAGLAGVDIPLGARLIHVADAFDAMTTPSPHHPPRDLDDALLELRRCSGKQFDPLAVDSIQEAYRLGLLDRYEVATA